MKPAPLIAVRGLLIAIVLAGCSAGWTRSASYTTCDQWRNEMTASQRSAMAGPILAALRSTVDTAASDGADMLPAFVDAVTAACGNDTLTPYRSSGTPFVVTAAATLVFLGPTGAGSPFQP